MPAILYARFSPRPGADLCESVDRQLDDMRRYCQARGIEIAGEYSDKALSGGDGLADRPGLFDAIRACRKGYVFMVRAFDRLFRDARQGLMVAYDLEQRGVQIVSITEESASLNTPEARMMRSIFLIIAEYQREIIRAKTRAAMQRHQSGGRRMTRADRVPWGWRIDGENAKRIVPCEDERAIARQVQEMQRQGMSLRAIAKELEQRGVQRRGNPAWTHSAIKTVIQSL